MRHKVNLETWLEQTAADSESSSLTARQHRTLQEDQRIPRSLQRSIDTQTVVFDAVNCCDCPFAATHAMSGQELWRQRPRSVPHYFVHVAAVSDGVVALVLIHHREALVFVGQVIAAHFEQTAINKGSSER